MTTDLMRYDPATGTERPYPSEARQWRAYHVTTHDAELARKEVTMACEHCTDPDGEHCFPMYGAGPHKHVGVSDNPKSWIGSTVALPKEEWPENYREDVDCPGMGVWWCPHCGDGKPSE